MGRIFCSKNSAPSAKARPPKASTSTEISTALRSESGERRMRKIRRIEPAPYLSNSEFPQQAASTSALLTQSGDAPGKISPRLRLILANKRSSVVDRLSREKIIQHRCSADSEI